MRLFINTTLFITIITLVASISYAKKLDCKHHYTDTIWGEKVEVCYAKNYTNYTPKKAANEFLANQIFVKGGRFNLNNNPKTHTQMKSFYIGKYLVPFQQYNAYLKATDQWNEGKPKGEQSRNRLNFETLNGLYPATATYKNAQGFCKWMGKLTGLDVELPQFAQWLYAATSRGKNWDYPTDNGKLELGDNYPIYNHDKDKQIYQKVTGNPVNSLGIHQFFGNNWQWTQSILTRNNAPYFNVSGNLGENILGGTAYTNSPDQVKKIKLSSNFAKTGKGKGNQYGNASFRCVINTNKPIPKHLNEVKSSS